MHTFTCAIFYFTPNENMINGYLSVSESLWLGFLLMEH